MFKEDYVPVTAEAFPLLAFPAPVGDPGPWEDWDTPPNRALSPNPDPAETNEGPASAGPSLYTLARQRALEAA